MTQRVCDPGMIQRFLFDQLSESELTSFVAHLDECESCGEQLNQLSADDDVWLEARTFLGTDPPGSDAAFERDTIRYSAQAEAYQPRSLGFLSPSDDPRMLGRFGPYEVIGVVGWGGMGVVLKGFDAALNRYVAIKVLAPQLATDGTARRRFAREAQAAAAVVHDNVIPIYGVDEFNELPYLVMPYIGGSSLQRRIEREGPLAVSEALRIAAQTAAGLTAAHAQGLVHRDIKPANLLLPNSVERVRITDFGLARAADDRTLTRIGVIAGTPEYMSPEQARGESVDYRSDLFSLGSVLYAMCTGSSPFRAKSSYGVLQKISEHDARPLRELNAELPDWLERLVGKLHAKQPEERFESAEETAAILRQCLAHTQNPAEPLPACLVDESNAPLRDRLKQLAVLACFICVICAAITMINRGAKTDTTLNSAVSGTADHEDDIVAFDDFNGTLALEWKPIRHDSSHVSLTRNPGKLTITTQLGTIHERAAENPGGQPAKNIFVIDNPLEDGDFVVTTMLDGFTPSEGQQQAGLILYDDDDNYVKWSYEANLYNNKQKFVLVRETDGAGKYSDLGGPQGLDRYWLRIRRKGTQYEFAASTDGKHYRFGGMKDWPGNPRQLGLIAKNGDHPDTTRNEVDAPFAFLEVRRER